MCPNSAAPPGGALASRAPLSPPGSGLDAARAEAGLSPAGGFHYPAASSDTLAPIKFTLSGSDKDDEALYDNFDEAKMGERQQAAVEKFLAADHRLFLSTPCPPDVGMMRTIVTRRRKGRFSAPEYICETAQGHRFLMKATKKSKGPLKPAQYMLWSKLESAENDSQWFDGRLTPNVANKTYTLTMRGPEKPRRELAAIFVAPNEKSRMLPRQMAVAVPVPPTRGPAPGFLRRGQTLRSVAQSETGAGSLVTLVNKVPEWRHELGMYSLNFAARVKQASVKNVQLHPIDDEANVVFQFGRRDADTFCLDWKWPLTPRQAFATALVSFDSSIGTEW